MLCHLSTRNSAIEQLNCSSAARFRKRIPQLLVLTSLAVSCAMAVQAQSRFVSSWEQRVRKSVAEQPAWPVPVVTPASGLVQLARFDAVRQITSTHTETWIYGNGKGFDFIPWYKTEVDITLPSYIEHNSKVRDGAGDWLMLLKYRFLAAGPKKGDNSLSASINGTVPTGSYKNGGSDSSIAPTLYGGKGFGRFDMRQPSAPHSADGSPTATTGTGSFSSTCPSGSFRSS